MKRILMSAVLAAALLAHAAPGEDAISRAEKTEKNRPGIAETKAIAEEGFIYPSKRQPAEVGIRCRSLLGILYFLAQAVEPTAPHVRDGLVTVTKDASGQPFDWTRVTGKALAIHSRPDRPAKASVAVEHRGWWFCIADDDQNSKATFSLVNILFSLRSATGKGKSPVTNLPVGK